MKTRIKEKALELGFDLFGVAPPELDPRDEEQLTAWLTQGRQAGMEWMTKHQSASPEKILPGARSVLCLGLLYNLPDTTLPSGAGRVAKYARGGDYHKLIESRLKTLIAFLKEEFQAEAKGYVDTGPLLERSFARRAGLGAVGKNTTLINEALGSFFFLAEILTTLELEFDPPLETADLCGACRRCLEACPTGALTAPYRLDARRCLSYLTIEHRGEIPGEVHGALRRTNSLFGCDICQRVCPYNERAPMTEEAEFNPRYEFLDLEAVLAVTEEEFHEQFRGSPIKRAKLSGLKRNARILLEDK